MTDPRAPLTESLEVLLRFGALMLRAGDTAFRVRDAMHRLAQALGIERLEVELSTVGLTATAWIGGEATTLTRETGPPGVDASKIAALEALSLGAAAGLDTATLGAELDRIEKAAPLHGLLPVALSMAVASTAFSYLNGGDLLATGAAAVSGGIGQAARTLLSRQGFNQFAMTALCAVLASGLYCLIVIGFGVRTFAFAHAIGFISSVLFLVPGFPLVAALLDLTQHQTKAGVTRLFYGVLLTLSAACGMSVVAMLAGLAPAPAAPPPGAIEPLTVLGRALACLAGGYGYGILFNNPHRTVLAVALLSMVGNEVRLGLHDLGLALPQATFFGALAVGLGASLVRGRLHAPRIALTVPSIIMMTPGLFAFQTIVFLNQGKSLAAVEAAATCGFSVGGMAMGLVASRFLTERQWRYER
ncbi:threonine/serine exporter family protein [uncultured Reyranella sp.]|uniref:threonine/serine ThrE exporter family protein n=1 Tax=uncultured Reyranella sp. TaxID=735512 RepID=UPI00259CBB48|nr:threonine/serine exporter family protein [uncultured Reyranella sp.]